MIVEVTGPSGVGKSTFIKNLVRNLSDSGLLTGAICTSEDNHCELIPSYFSDLSNHNIKTDLAALPWCVALLIVNPKFLFFALGSIIFIDGSIPDKIAMLRSFVRKAGIYRFLKCKRFSGITILVDEGLFHSAHNFLCSPNSCAPTQSVRDFFRLCPPPDRLILLMSSEKRLVEQLLGRGDLSPRVAEEKALISFVIYSRRLFDCLSGLCKSKGYGLLIDLDITDESEMMRRGEAYAKPNKVA